MTTDSAAVSILGYDGTIRYISTTVANLLGYLPEEMTGHSFRRFVDRAHLRQIVHDWAQLTASDSTGGETRISLVTRDGNVLPVRMDVLPIPDRDEYIVCYKGVTRGHDQLAALSTILTALTGTLKLSEILDLILEQLANVIPGDYYAVILLRGDQPHAVRRRGYMFKFMDVIPEKEWNELPNVRRVRETRHPQIINNTYLDEDWIHYEGMEQILSWIGIPLLYKGQFFGILEACSHQPDAYTIADARAGQLFGQQAASAIRHAQLYHAVRSRASRLKALNNIGVGLSRLKMDDVIHMVYQGVASTMDAEVFYIALYDPEFKTMSIMHIKGREGWLPDNDQAPLTGLLGYVMQRRETLIIHDTEREGYPIPSLKFGEQEDTRTLIIVPLIARDEIIGVLSVQSYQPNKFRPSDIQMLEAMASQTAVAVRNAQLYDAAAQQLAALASLQQISLRLATRLEASAILDLIAEEVITLLHPDDVRLYMYDPHFVCLSLALERTPKGRSTTNADPQPGSIAEKVAASGTPLIINDQPGHPMLQLESDQETRAVHTMVGYPIRHAGLTYGVVTLSYRQHFRFRQDHGRILGLLLNQAASAIENARHSAEVSRRLAEMSALYQVAHQVSGRLQLDDILRDVVYTLHGIFPCRACMIALRDENTAHIRIRAAAGLDPTLAESLQFELGQGVFGNVVQNGTIS